MRGERGDRGGRAGGGERAEAGERPKKREMARARVWVLRDGTPAAVSVRRGVQNTRHAEVVSDELKEGDLVIVGTAGGPAQAGGAPANPFMPQMPRGGGRRGGF
jgi:hypothetical protein